MITKRKTAIIGVIAALGILTTFSRIRGDYYISTTTLPRGKQNLMQNFQLFLNQFFEDSMFLSDKMSKGFNKTDEETLAIVSFNESTFKEEMNDLWNRVDYFYNYTLPSVPKSKLRTRKMTTNFTYLDFNNLQLIRTFIKQNKTLKVTKKNRFLHYDLENEPMVNITDDDDQVYFRNYGNASCFIEGTQPDSVDICECQNGWFGEWCSFPSVLRQTRTIISSDLLLNVKPRKIPRRIINLMTFNMEYEMLLIRLGELGNVTDRFVILESNITSYGDPKPLYLMSMLKRGFVEDYHRKIIYTYCKHFLTEAYLNGWLADDHTRRQLDETVTQRLIGLRDDDIIMYTDADEIPKRESMLFLKLHDGFPEIISINYDRRSFGFFWKEYKQNEHLLQVAATFRVYKNVFQNHSNLLRNSRHPRYVKFNKDYLYRMKYDLRKWGIGKGSFYGGWHCSSCLNPESIIIKMQSAVNEDYPRWGDHAETYDMERLKYFIIGEGHNFDNRKTLRKIDNNTKGYIPQYVAENKELFLHLISNPYSK